MSEETLDAEAVSEFLAQGSPPWREAGQEGDSPQVRELRQWQALYTALINDLPDLGLTSELVATIVEEGGIGGGFLSCSEMSVMDPEPWPYRSLRDAIAESPWQA